MKFSRVIRFIFFVFFLASCTKQPPPASDSSTAAGEKGLDDFTLLDHNGVSHSLYRETEAKAIVIIGHGNACPIIQRYAETVHALHDSLEKQGVRVWLLNANTQDGRDSVLEEDKEYNYGAPILLDQAQIVARELGLSRTAEAVVIQPKTWKILYRGAIDDRLGYGVDKQEPKLNFLKDAVREALAGEKITVAQSTARGCKISYRELGKLTYVKDVAPILNAKCISCHSPGGLYKPYFEGFESVKGWAKMIRETLLTQRMPPPTLDPHFGHFKNIVSLTPADEATMFAWLDGDMERGEGRDPTQSGPHAGAAKKLPPKIWEVGMEKPLAIDPKGTLEYEYLEIGGPAPYDMWMTAFKTTTSNPRQLHHESLMIVKHPLSYYEEIAKRRRDQGLVDGNTDGDLPLWILDAMKDAYVSGDDPYFVRKGVFASGRPQPDFMPDGTALFIPKGHYAMLEVHYVGNGHADQEKTRIELFGQRALPKGVKLIRSTAVIETDYVIPPRERSFVVSFKPRKFKNDINIRFLLAHMHVRGRSMKMELLSPTGVASTLVSIPNFDFSWHTGAEIVPEKPILVPRGSALRVTCEFDNSAGNPSNPDPDKEVRFGQTFDRAEMCKMNIGYTDAN